MAVKYTIHLIVCMYGMHINKKEKIAVCLNID